MGRREKYFLQIQRKSKFLGMCASKARRILVNKIIYKFFSDSDGMPYCYRCGEPIDTMEFHIDHKKAWMHEPDGIELYFDVNNLSLSHPLCNSMSRRSSSNKSVKDRVVNALIKTRAHTQRQWARRKKLKNA